jgi:general secretion pathway protein G
MGGCVVLLLAVISALCLPRVVGGGDRGGPRTGVGSELATYKSLLDHFHLDCGRYPTTEEGLNALHVAPASLKDKWGPQPYTDKTSFNDPWGNPYLYLSNDPNQYTLKSYGEDGQPGGDGYAADIEAEP